MDINEIATKKDIARLENLLHKLLVVQSNNENVKKVQMPKEFENIDAVSEDRALEILGIKRATLYGWKSQGKIPYYKPEGNSKGVTYYKISELQNFMCAIKHKSNDEIEAEADAHILKQKLKREHKVKSK